MEPSAVRKAMTLPPVQKKSQWSKGVVNLMVKQSPAERPLKPISARVFPAERLVPLWLETAPMAFWMGMRTMPSQPVRKKVPLGTWRESSVVHPETPPARQQMSLALVRLCLENNLLSRGKFHLIDGFVNRKRFNQVD